MYGHKAIQKIKPQANVLSSSLLDFHSVRCQTKPVYHFWDDPSVCVFLDNIVALVGLTLYDSFSLQSKLVDV